jgi:hypothetical protein
MQGTRWRIWLRHFATSRKVAGSIPDEAITFFFSLPNISSRTMALGFTEPMTRNEYQKMFPGSRARPAHKTDNLTAICEAIM